MLVCFIVMIGIIIGTALKLPYKQEVTGSIPVSPTNKINKLQKAQKRQKARLYCNCIVQ